MLGIMMATAQPRKIENIDPQNKNYADLEFLRDELKDKRIVMLGEPSHQEGNVFSAKIRLIKFLHEKMGFNVIAFESGFFEVQQAQEKINNGGEVTRSLDNALFPIWTRSKQFEPLMDYIREQRSSLRLVGFDPQFSASRPEDFLSVLKQYIIEHKQAYRLNEILLSETIESLIEGTFPDGIAYPTFSTEIKKAREVIEKIAKDEPSSAEIWLQNLKSIESLAADYYKNRPGDKGSEDFKAKDSNPRDRQMADNLIFWTNRNPGEKVICWGAALHFADHPELLENEELKAYKPMGRWVREAFGGDKIYTLATISKGGNYAAWFEKEPKPVPPTAPGSIEEQLGGDHQRDYRYLTERELQIMGKQTTSMFDYAPIAGNWSKVTNGILFFPEYSPSQAVDQSPAGQGNDPSGQANKNDKTRALPDSRIMLKIRKAGELSVSGKLSDLDDGQPIAAATIQLLPSKESAITDINGKFELASDKEAFGEMLKVSSVGYKDTLIQVGRGPLVIKLRKSVIDLEEIEIRPSDGNAIQIVRKAFQAIDRNLNQEQYVTGFYVNSNVSSIDSSLYHIEYKGKFSKPKGSRDKYLSKVLQLHWIKKSQSTLPAVKNGLHYLDGYLHINGGNPVLQHPMFNTAALGRFRFEILEDLPDSYVVGFESRTKSHFYTNGYYLKSFSGIMVINKSDDAILKTTLRYKLDTTTLNRFARNYDKKKGENQTIFLNVLDQDQVEVSTNYLKSKDGYYYPQQTIIIREQSGHELENGKPMLLHAQTTVRFMETSPDTGNEDSYQKVLNFNQVKYNSSFWNGYQRPM
jgi:erythromycin esterase-like protein